ncbi:MAG: hypothetical protein JNL93_15670 [Pelomonas sp.]|nr:hypothetical protein [Roseateles sp.]
MKFARCLLLVLLTLVLPLRGAMANIACCSGELPGFGVPVAQAHDHADVSASDAATGGHHDHHDHDEDSPGHNGRSDPSDKCHACTASCSAASIVSAMPVLPMPTASADVVFPSLLAPPPSHASEGQERPPRSC